MVTNSELNAYISRIDWTQESSTLKEFAQRFHLPQVGKVTKGQFECIGLPSISSPNSKSLILWLNGGKILKIAASCVKFKEERNHLGYSHFRMTPFGSKLAIPSNYNGYFEILSEEGKSVKCIESVRELFKRFPSQVLCRDNIKVYLACEDNEQMISEKSKILKKGDIIKLLSRELTTVDHWSSSSFSISEPSNQSQSKGSFYKLDRFLKCLSSSNDIVFLNLESKGKFSQIDKEDSISGVHTMSSLLSKRLPLMVRLVHSAKPNDLRWFVPEMRLYSVFEEDYLIAMPLHKDSSIISVPLNAPLKLVGPKACEQIINYSIFSKLNQKYEEIKSEATNKIQIYHSSLISKDLKNKWLDVNHSLNCKKRYQPMLSSSQHKEHDTDVESLNRVQNKLYYDEIDQIYDYIRGLAPLPDKYQSKVAKMDTYLEPKLPYASFHEMIDSFDKLCKRKSSEDLCSMIHVSTNGQANFKGQTNHSAKPKLLINKCKIREPCEVQSLPKIKKVIKLTQNVSSSDQRINDFISNKLTCPRINTRTHSSLFNIRYKSLNNIHFVNPLDEYYSKRCFSQTLGSCNSSGRASIGSAYSEDMYKYKSVKRPILLSNLFWEEESNDEAQFGKLEESIDSPVLNHQALNDCFKNLNEISLTSKAKHLGTLYL